MLTIRLVGTVGTFDAATWDPLGFVFRTGPDRALIEHGDQLTIGFPLYFERSLHDDERSC